MSSASRKTRWPGSATANRVIDDRNFRSSGLPNNRWGSVSPDSRAAFDRVLYLRHDGEDFAGEVDPSWSIGFAINGGVLLAALGRALGLVHEAHGHPHPLAVAAFYLGPATGGPFTVHTESVRVGRTVSTGQARLTQPSGPDQAERVRVMATFGDLGRLGDGEVRTTATPPRLPAPQECVRSENKLPGADLPFVDQLDLRLDPATAGWAVGAPSGQGLMQGWFRHLDGREPDVWSLLLALDSMPPVTFGMGAAGWAPTLELTAHVRALPAPGWLRLRAWTDNLAGGLFEETAEVWDSRDRLVAQSRQLARAGRG